MCPRSTFQGDASTVTPRSAPRRTVTAGNVSSQYISGLLMALPLLIRDSLLMVSGPLESAAYVAMTEDALQLSKLTIPKMGAMWAQ